MGERSERKSIRLPDFDYSQPGAYFVTIVTHDRRNIFSRVINNNVELTVCGKIVKEAWSEIPKHYSNVSLGDVVIMPNHLHGIIIIEADIVGAGYTPPLQEHIEDMHFDRYNPIPLGRIINTFKGAVTRQIHRVRILQNQPIWQRNYYEHIIRNEDDYEDIVNYIHANPSTWERDDELLEQDWKT